MGSSPHTRGAPSNRSPRKCRPRIIPAYAGSTDSPHSPATTSRDHPRIRGEHFRLRGLHCRHIGIIPAYAGSTRYLHLRRQACMDHPRIRGEHGSTPLTPDESMGSSPHTRGAQVAELGLGILPRIIPAYAGSTSVRRPRLALREDHPRIRGEHLNERAARQRRKGSSPHTRGAHGGWRRGKINSGIIPAYAGSTGGSKCR